MAPGLGDGFRTFWHAMTSNDRHANHDSPYRALTSNTHQPLGVGRNPPLQSVSSPGMETSLSLGYHDDPAARSTTALAGQSGVYSPRSPPNGTVRSPGSPYSPGMRSATTKPEGAPSGIAMQDFGADGLPPPPPIGHSWSRIDRWAEENFPELHDQLCTPATLNDINELEYSLDCSLPMEVRESLEYHDGQERGGTPTGIIFGAMLLDCEEMVDEWKNWRAVEKEFLAPVPMSNSATDDAGSTRQNRISLGRASLLARQDSHPEGAVQKVYAHAGWIPLVRDWGGNNIAVDLAPGPNGTWGQIILFGRDYDCKFVVAKSWAHFLAMVADDMQSDHWYVDEETQELKLKDPRAPRSDPSYLEILRVRNERKYGRRRINRRSGSVPNSPHLMTMSPASFSASNTPNGPNGSAAAKGGLTKPAKEENLLSDSHLKPPSKKSAKSLKSVSEEISVPVPVHTKTENQPAKSLVNLLDEPVDENVTSTMKTLGEVTLSENKIDSPQLKRSSADLISQPPLAATKSASIEV